VLFGGEVADPRWVERILREGAPARLLHVYGPTETTTFATWHEVREVAPGAVTIPIGRPIANTEVYVLDRHGELAPAGVPGEIRIGGPGLARGYLGSSEATADRFIAHPFDRKAGARLYRTGDRARYRDDGQIEFLGRLDRQVKIRGFRVEPAEIEAVLLQQPGVREAAVVARSDSSGSRQIVACVVPEAGARLTSDDLRRAARSTLPSFMVPATFVVIEKLPKSSAGKIDYQALPVPARSGDPEPQLRVPPDSLTGHALVAIWEDLLGVSPIGIRDSFFDLGGHSLLAARMLEAVEQASGRRLPLSTLLTEPTIERLTAALRSRSSGKGGGSPASFNAGGSRTPIVFLHGDFVGGGLYCHALARALGPDQPLVVLPPHGLRDDRVPGSIAEMAAELVTELKASRAVGPFILGGHCNGALVALEMARTLTREGERVPLVALLDAAAPRSSERMLARLAALADACRRTSAADRGERLLRWQARRTALRDRLRYRRRRLHEIRRADLRARAEFIGRATGKAVVRISRILSRTPGRRRDVSAMPADDVEQRYRRAMVAYAPRRYAGRVLVLRPEQTEDRRPDLGWSMVCARVDVRTVPGDHHSCLVRHVEATARQLRAAVDEIS
jgi:thioesterase domain-containing protein